MNNITYSELLLQLFEVVKEVKKEENKNYQPSQLFASLNELLNLEKICDDYFSRYDNLTEAELNNFNGFAALIGASRRKIKEDYEKAYKKGLIDKQFLDEYPGIMDYVAAIFLNELDGSFFNKNFVKIFNEQIKNVYTEDETLLNIFKMHSVNYKRLYQEEDNLGILFKYTLKEFELLTKIYNANGLDGVISVKHYDTLLSIIKVNRKNAKVEKEFASMDEYEKFENIEKFIEEISEPLELKESLTGVYLKLQNSKYWFANQYLTLMLNITDKNSDLFKLLIDPKISYAAGLFINYLSNDDFFKAVTIEEDGQIVFKDLSNLINKLQKYKLNDNNGQISNDHINYSIEGMESIFQDVKDGKIKIGNLGSRYGSI